MADYAYTTVPGKLKPLLAKLREVGVPSKMTTQWLKSVGFTSSNDTTLIGVMRFIGFIDASSIPTARWNQYRGAHHRKVLGEAIRAGYSELYAVYPDAHQRTQVDLDHVFKTSSSAGNQVIAKTVSTFKALTEEADFDSTEQQTELGMSTGPLHVPAAQSVKASSSGGGPNLHIDIQIHISPESTPEQIDQIFKSMGKHLYGNE